MDAYAKPELINVLLKELDRLNLPPTMGECDVINGLNRDILRRNETNA